MHSSYFLNHKSSRPKNDDTEEDEDIIVELSTKKDQRKVILTGSKEEINTSEDEVEEGYLSDSLKEVDYHNLEEPSFIENSDEEDMDLITIQSLRESHQQKLDQVEREYLSLREKNNMSVDVDKTRNVRIKNPMNSYRTVTFSDQFDEEPRNSPKSDTEERDFSQVNRRVSEIISEVSLDDDNTSVSSDDTEFKQDYKHYFNDPSLHNQLIDEESVERDYNYNDISDTCTVISDVSEFVKERDAEGPTENIERKNITVPLPFKFEDREARKPLGIHRRKMDDYINKIKMEEEHHLNKRFKANPVPKSTKTPLYESVRIRTELQTKLERKALEEMTKKIIKPFYFAERDERRSKQLEEEKILKQEEHYMRFEKGFVANPGLFQIFLYSYIQSSLTYFQTYLYYKTRKRITKEK